jgi:hypothetical protein
MELDGRREGQRSWTNRSEIGFAISGTNTCASPRVQSGGRPLRIFYAFDPRRTAILLIGGDKTGRDRFYEEFVPKADALYDAYIEELIAEGLI